ncbi:hypothetical protein A0J61_02505 [Choanephora cucurbitarum]|uniref:Sugar phosphate phosphatase n=1 Tax=Choanephora cucurbitarum TaxID=101091 RepID=A0A1C7NK73_9FUNG|nr:hypothetical protein A0J61_02505 [Choanephora cucurbitarum]
MTDILPNNPPYPAYRATNKESFAYDTTVRRWPIIIDSAITDVKTTSGESKQERVEESENIISALEEIKQEIAKNTPLRLIKDKRHDAEKWNQDLTKYFPEATWFSGTWLFNECYLYRRIAEIFNNSKHWVDYDCFERQKNDTFKGSYNAVFDLARKMPELIKPMSEEKQEIIYDELIQICLWGNATDLSLLTNMSQEDIHRLQAVEQDRLAERRKFILADDTEKLWQKIKTLDNDRVDFVLDNSGFEVYVDMIFADWLLQTKKAGKVVFNCKTIPWFVSDVMPKDMPLMFDHCLDRDFFPHREDRSEEDFQALEVMVKRWKDYVATGQLEIRSDDFWCTGHAYWYMESVAPELFQDLATQSKLVIFKGDLNFRKLVFDCDWPVTTPFREAIGPSMAKNFTNIVSLRTNKADPIVGLTEETKKEIESKASRDEWRFSGKYAVVVYN